MYLQEVETDKYIFETFFKDYIGIMVEAGAGPTVGYSMSKIFRENGWRTICIEPNPYFVEMHKKEGNEIYQYALSNQIVNDHDFEIIRPNSEDQLAFSAIRVRYDVPKEFTKKIIKVDIITLNWLLDTLEIKKVDFVSLDVEGWELDVMAGFDTNIYKPEIILLENFEHDESYNLYMSSIGYILINKITHNYIYKKI
jgi:FkbM family methyltransferase